MSAAVDGAVPPDIDSPSGKLVYLALAVAGEGDVDALCRRLDMKRVSVYSILAALESRGLVERAGSDSYRVAT